MAYAKLFQQCFSKMLAELSGIQMECSLFREYKLLHNQGLNHQHDVETSLRLRSPAPSDTVKSMNFALRQDLVFGNAMKRRKTVLLGRWTLKGLNIQYIQLRLPQITVAEMTTMMNAKVIQALYVC